MNQSGFNDNYDCSKVSGYSTASLMFDNEPQDLIFQIANWFLSKESMSNKKLQKLCYYAYCWCIILLEDAEDEDCDKIDTEICREGFEAWIHGPVCRKLYYKYKKYGWEDIPLYKQKISLPGDVLDVLNQVWDAYGSFTAGQLERLTHSEDPWIKARKRLNYDIPSSAKIDPNVIRGFYINQLVDE